MSKDRDDERNTGMPGEETFSLEEILAEFGGGAAKPRWKEDTIPFPVTPRSQRTAPSPAGPPGPGKVVSFPSGRREDPPPVPPPQPEPEEPPEDGDKVLEFPGEEGPASDNPIAEGLNRLMDFSFYTSDVCDDTARFCDAFHERKIGDVGADRST